MLFLVYVFMNTSSEYDRTTYTPKPRVQPAPSYQTLTTPLKNEICREMIIWTGYCYDTGIKLEDCAMQFNEKTMRLYQISAQQLVDTIEYCKIVNQIDTTGVDQEDLKRRWDATTGKY